MKFQLGDKVIINESSEFFFQNPRDESDKLIPGRIVGLYDKETNRTDGKFERTMLPTFIYRVRWGEKYDMPYYNDEDLIQAGNFKTNQEAKRLLDASF